MMLEILGLVFLVLIVVVCLLLAGIWLEQEGPDVGFWIFLVVGIAFTIWFSYLSNGAKIWAS